MAGIGDGTIFLFDGWQFFLMAEIIFNKFKIILNILYYFISFLAKLLNVDINKWSHDFSHERCVNYIYFIFNYIFKMKSFHSEIASKLHK